ncbi:hypothetical protein ABZ729_04865 [Streptomyces sp. NPDC006678]|uniref:hypothetical protein n=1 Tax=Streptomyces sp. NPDC006678 TaxID=3157185 RepID=UPI0033CD63C9
MTRIVIPEIHPPTGTIASIPGSGAELPATYIHHCHILEHEDDDLMRPWTIVGDDGDHGDGDHGRDEHGGGGPGGGHSH